MKKILIDTNILIYSIDKESVFHNKSYEIVNSKQFDKYISSKNISEFLSVTTRETIYSLSIEEVLESLDFFISNFTILYPSIHSLEIFNNNCGIFVLGGTPKIKNNKIFNNQNQINDEREKSDS